MGLMVLKLRFLPLNIKAHSRATKIYKSSAINTCTRLKPNSAQTSFHSFENLRTLAE